MEHFNFGGSELTRGHMFQMLLRISIASVITYYSVKWMMNQIDPTSKSKKKAKLLAEEQLKRLVLSYARFTLRHILVAQCYSVASGCLSFRNVICRFVPGLCAMLGGAL